VLFEHLKLNQLETLSKLISITLCILFFALFFASGYRMLILILMIIILVIFDKIEKVENSKKQIEIQKRKTKIKNRLNKTFRKLKQNPEAFRLFVNFVKKWKDEKYIIELSDSLISVGPRYRSPEYINEKIIFTNLLQTKYNIKIDIRENNEIRKFFGVPDEFEYLFDLIEQTELPKMMAEEEYQKFKRLTNDIKTKSIESYIDRFLDIYGDNWENNIHNLKRLLKEKENKISQFGRTSK